MLPDFIIIGAQKSASTFVQACLAEHPEVFMPAGEIPFFESPDYEEANGDLRRLAALFHGRTEKRLGIKRPNYLGKAEVAPRIAKDLPEARLLAVLRNPVARAVSAYYHQINNGLIPPLHVEVGMRRLLHNPAYAARYPRSRQILEFGEYHRHLRRFQPFLDRGQMLLELHEDVEADPHAALKRLFNFLAVDPTFVPTSIHSRPQAVVYNLTRLRILTLRNRHLYRYNADRTRFYANEPRGLARLTVKMIGATDRLLARVLGNTKPTLTADLRRDLHNLYRDDIAALECLLGRDLTAWKEKSVQ